jgi:hypothetical protein
LPDGVMFDAESLDGRVLRGVSVPNHLDMVVVARWWLEVGRTSSSLSKLTRFVESLLDCHLDLVGHSNQVYMWHRGWNKGAYQFAMLYTV